MTYDFDTLYQEFVTDIKDQGCTWEPTVSRFIASAMANINDDIFNEGRDPRPEDLWVIEYAQANGLTERND